MCAFVCLGVPGLGPSRGLQIPESGYQNSFLVAGPQGTPDTVKYKVSRPKGAPDTVKYKMSGPRAGLYTVKQKIFGAPGDKRESVTKENALQGRIVYRTCPFLGSLEIRNLPVVGPGTFTVTLHYV